MGLGASVLPYIKNQEQRTNRVQGEINDDGNGDMLITILVADCGN